MLTSHIIFKRSSEEEPETATSERIKSQESYTVGDEALLIYTHQTAGGNIDGVETAPKITRWMRGIIQAENKTKVCMSRLDDMVTEGMGVTYLEEYEDGEHGRWCSSDFHHQSPCHRRS